jgi:hypothetical protein
LEVKNFVIHFKKKKFPQKYEIIRDESEDEDDEDSSDEEKKSDEEKSEIADEEKE